MATRPASENPFPEVLLSEVAAPSAAPSGKVRLYAKSDGLPYVKDDAGAETALGSAAHVADTSDAHDASAISFSPAGTIAATDVQAAIEEVAAEASGGGSLGGACVRKTTQNVANATITALTFDTEDYDDTAYHSNVTNPTRLTIPATGRYRVSAGGFFGFTDSNELDLFVTLNGSTTLSSALFGQTLHTATGKHINVSRDLPLTSGDYIEALLYHDNGSTRAFTDAYFTIERLA